VLAMVEPSRSWLLSTPHPPRSMTLLDFQYAMMSGWKGPDGVCSRSQLRPAYIPLFCWAAYLPFLRTSVPSHDAFSGSHWLLMGRSIELLEARGGRQRGSRRGDGSLSYLFLGVGSASSARPTTDKSQCNYCTALMVQESDPDTA